MLEEIDMLIDVHKDTKEKMKKAVAAAEHDFATIRTGRASVNIIDGVMIEAYGSPVPIKQVANLSVPDPKTIVITPWDKTIMGAIEKAILAANLGFTPNNDGKVIRINIPPLTEERRKEYVKMAKQKAEDGKISIRNIRRHAIEEVKKLEKDKKITEDESKKANDEIQKYTDEFIEQITKALTKKEQEILTV